MITRAWIPACLALSLAVGCGASDLEDRLAQYHQQVREVLGSELPSSSERSLHEPLPARRNRRLDAATHHIGGFDFLALQGCRLSELVGKRNSQMGRMMVPSQRLVYELEVLEAASDCIDALADERSRRLATLIDQKRGELPIHVWNAIWIGEEMESFLSASANPLARGTAAEGAAALKRSADIVSRPLQRASDARDLEQTLGKLRYAQPAGAVLRSLDQLRYHLDSVATLLEPRAPTGCRGDEVRLRRIFETNYLPLQSEIATLDRGGFAQIESLDRLFSASAARVPEPPPAMLRYHAAHLRIDHETGSWQRYRRALLRHTRAWEPTLTLCGVLPTDQAT